MKGAFIGDYIGSVYEFYPVKYKDFELFLSHSTITDDSVCTFAVAHSLMNNLNLQDTMLAFCRSAITMGYGGNFMNWVLSDNPEPYNSYGNGSAMRVSSVAWLGDSIEDVYKKAKWSAEITHNHIEGVKGAQATAVSIRMALEGYSKEEIKQCIEQKFGYDLSRKIDDIRKNYIFYVSCQKSVPESIICFLESENYEDAIRNAVSLGGDADTMAAIAGSIAEAFYKNIPTEMSETVTNHLEEKFPAFYKVYEQFKNMTENKIYEKTEWKNLPEYKKKTKDTVKTDKEIISDFEKMYQKQTKEKNQWQKFLDILKIRTKHK